MRRTQLLMLQLARQELWKISTTPEIYKNVDTIVNELKVKLDGAMDDKLKWDTIKSLSDPFLKLLQSIKNETDKLDAVIGDLEEELEKE